MLNKRMDESLTEHGSDVVKSAFPERSFWLLCAECWWGGTVGRDQGQHSSNYKAVIIEPRNGRASTRTEVMKWELEWMRAFRRKGT